MDVYLLFEPELIGTYFLRNFSYHPSNDTYVLFTQ
jgi:hypothetical protein